MHASWLTFLSPAVLPSYPSRYHHFKRSGMASKFSDERLQIVSWPSVPYRSRLPTGRNIQQHSQVSNIQSIRQIVLAYRNLLNRLYRQPPQIQATHQPDSWYIPPRSASFHKQTQWEIPSRHLKAQWSSWVRMCAIYVSWSTRARCEGSVCEILLDPTTLEEQQLSNSRWVLSV